MIAKVAEKIRRSHPGISYHLFSGNAEDVTERIDRGLLDFGILIEPAGIKKYDFIRLPTKTGGDCLCGVTIPWQKKAGFTKGSAGASSHCLPPISCIQ